MTTASISKWWMKLGIREKGNDVVVSRIRTTVEAEKKINTLSLFITTLFTGGVNFCDTAIVVFGIVTNEIEKIVYDPVNDCGEW